jgi:hypothetical protein
VRESLPPLPPMDIHPPTSTTAVPVPTLATTSRCAPAVSPFPIPPLSLWPPLPPFQIPHLPFPFVQATSYVQAFLRPKAPPCPLVRMGSRSPPPLFPSRKPGGVAHHRLSKDGCCLRESILSLVSHQLPLASGTVLTASQLALAPVVTLCPFSRST